jgi:hypothetical protein
VTSPSSPAGALSSFLEADADQALVAAFDSLLEAELARGRLESEGIAARVVDGNTVALAQPLSMALGGVKLWVATENLEAARTVLFAPSALVEPLPGADDDDEPPARPPPLSPDDLAERAFRGAVLGLIVVPPLLNLYSLTLAARALAAPGTMSPKARKRTAVALVVDAAAVGAVAAMLAALL